MMALTALGEIHYDGEEEQIKHFDHLPLHHTHENLPEHFTHVNYPEQHAHTHLPKHFTYTNFPERHSQEQLPEQLLDHQKHEEEYHNKYEEQQPERDYVHHEPAKSYQNFYLHVGPQEIVRIPVHHHQIIKADENMAHGLGET